MSNIIEVKNLSKSYGEIKAVDNISFEVEQGKLFAFLGENGAGKSTTINMLCTSLAKDNGEIVINGFDIDESPDEVKKSIGIVYQNSVLDKYLTVQENLYCRGALYGMATSDIDKKIEELDKVLQIKSLLKRRYGTLSGGQRRKVDIVRGLLGGPKILFLDEPTTGLDPKSRRQVWDTISFLIKKTHLTVFLTTHYMEETEDADKVVIIDNGKIVASGSPNELKHQYAKSVLKLKVSESKKIDKILTKENRQFAYDNGHYMIGMSGSDEAKEFIKLHEDIMTDWEFTGGNMDMVFISVTGRKLKGE